jgi:Spy/CpxP family protein refolding chaperone
MFLGFFVGTLCLVGLAHTVIGRRHRYAHYASWRGGACGRGYGGDDAAHPFAREDFRDEPRYGDHPRRGGWGIVGAMLRRLNATPAQEKAILAAVDRVRRTVRELRSEAQDGRDDLARALREPTLDPAVLASARARVEAASHRIADALTEALTEIHGILDDRQRRMLGDVIASTWSSRW